MELFYVPTFHFARIFLVFLSLRPLHLEADEDGRDVGGVDAGKAEGQV
jgi:hypothetical protein